MILVHPSDTLLSNCQSGATFHRELPLRCAVFVLKLVHATIGAVGCSPANLVRVPLTEPDCLVENVRAVVEVVRAIRVGAVLKLLWCDVAIEAGKGDEEGEAIRVTDSDRGLAG